MKITFPHMGNVYLIAKTLFEELGVEYIIPPFNNKKALEIGTRYSPEMACLPLKINLGNFIQAADKGADTIIITGGCGPCRFGYYCEMHREILKDLGYNMDVVALEQPKGDTAEFLKRVKRLSKGAGYFKLIKAVMSALKIARELDRMDRIALKIRPREVQKGETDSVYRWFQTEVLKLSGRSQILDIIKKSVKKMKDIKIDRDRKCFRVGLVGEIYTVIDPFANISLESRLGSMGVEVERSIMLSEWINENIIKAALGLRRHHRQKKAAEPFIGRMIGGHAQETIGNTIIYSQEGYDGVIQLMPLTCMPEIVAESVLPAVQDKHGIPVMTLIIDEMTGEAGYQTRLEAFMDLLEKRRESSNIERKRVFSWS